MFALFLCYAIHLVLFVYSPLFRRRSRRLLGRVVLATGIEGSQKCIDRKLHFLDIDRPEGNLEANGSVIYNTLHRETKLEYEYDNVNAVGNERNTK